jgi:2-Cys peroxiredoxin 5
MPIAVGDVVPSATLHEGTPRNHVDPAELFATGRTVLFAVPGAFTPGCSKTHLPGYIADFEKFAAKGVDRVVCLSVNDAFVMAAWGEAQGATGKIRMLADPLGEFTRMLGLDVDAAALGGLRSKRYAMVIDNGRVSRLELEPDGFGLTCSLAPSLLETL